MLGLAVFITDLTAVEILSCVISEVCPECARPDIGLATDVANVRLGSGIVSRARETRSGARARGLLIDVGVVEQGST